MKMPKAWRLGFALGLYLALVFAAALAFSWMRRGVDPQSTFRYAYALFGPALSLFTHMSYQLFALQSLLLVPWIILGVQQSKWRRLAATGFWMCWIGIGCYMYDLF